MKKPDLILLLIAVICVVIVLFLIYMLQNQSLLQWMVDKHIISNTSAGIKNIFYSVLTFAVLTTVIIFILFIKLILKFLKN